MCLGMGCGLWVVGCGLWCGCDDSWRDVMASRFLLRFFGGGGRGRGWRHFEGLGGKGKRREEKAFEYSIPRYLRTE